MWRVPNRQRENGAFKVPTTPSTCFDLTPEGYRELCSAPRPWPPLAPPTLNPSLAVLFSACQDKVLNATKRVRSATKIDAELRRRFKSQVPPSIAAVMQGKIPSPLGWNKLALQLAILSHALGFDEDQLVEQCAGLLLNHASDGTRYNSPRKREAELRKLFHYSQNYALSIGGLRSILPKGFHARDLRGLA
jgi:hypothetical protein